MAMTPQKQTIFFFSVALAVILFAIVSGCTQSNERAGDDFSFVTLAGETKNLSDYTGKVVVLDCMAVNCQPCAYQMFELKKISENYTADEVVILSIDVWVSSGETAQLLQQYLNQFEEQLGMTLDWTFGLDDSAGTLQNTYASEGVPALYIFDKKGNIYYSHTGYESYSSLVIPLEEALAKT